MNHLLPSQQDEPNSFPLFRLTKSKKVVDLSPNTIRAYFRRGLRCYKQGRAIFVSKIELVNFITTQSAADAALAARTKRNRKAEPIEKETRNPTPAQIKAEAK